MRNYVLRIANMPARLLVVTTIVVTLLLGVPVTPASAEIDKTVTVYGWSKSECESKVTGAKLGLAAGGNRIVSWTNCFRWPGDLRYKATISYESGN